MYNKHDSNRFQGMEEREDQEKKQITIDRRRKRNKIRVS